jgi:hypothetical protein
MVSFVTSPNRLFLALECAFLFIVTPLVLYAHPTRLNVHLTLWTITAYAAFILHKTPDYSWREAWHGNGWMSRDIKLVAARYLFSVAGIFLLTWMIAPERLFAFPTGRPFFWLLVMLLYPLLSALPQELVFRNFFFRRYATLFPQEYMMLSASAFVFGFIHIVFHNPISPLLSLICGFFLASSYRAHQSLKKAAIEHALYGDMVFTIGLGVYFLAVS